MNKTSIEYLDYTWNPLAMRCTPVSAGCAHCWHLRMADRLAKNPRIPAGQRKAYSGEWLPMPVESRLEEPFRLKKPARIGVQFMGDLFHEGVPLSSITEIFDVMADARCQQHTFIVLTKRPERYNRWVNWVCECWPGDSAWGVTVEVCGHIPNVWLGVSVENQKTADERIPLLLQIPAAIRFVSVEPMLERINATNWLGKCMRCDVHGFVSWVKWTTMKTCGRCMEEMQCDAASAPMFYREMSGIDWAICASESGPGARPMDEDWVRNLRDQCVAADVPFLYKQQIVNGKRVSMPELDGKVWDQYPTEPE